MNHKLKVQPIKSSLMKLENKIIRSQRKKVYSLTIIFLLLCLCLAINIILAFFRYPIENNLVASLILGFLVYQAYQEMHTQWYILLFKKKLHDEKAQKNEGTTKDVDSDD